MLHRAKCWEYQKCGREGSGIKALELGTCPAYPDDGRNCWRVAGTMCEGKVQGTEAQKRDNCENCNWYKNIKSGLA
jgi:hypothetical protein